MIGELKIPTPEIIFEKGIAIYSLNGKWLINNSYKTEATSPSDIEQKYQVRPILHLLKTPVLQGFTEHFTLLDTKKDSLNLRVNCFRELLSDNLIKELFQEALNLEYVSNSLLYHCENLALIYAEISGHPIQSPFPYLNERLKNDNKIGLGNYEQAWFEFDALMTSARRFYEALKFPIWKLYGTKNNVPSTYSDLFNSKNRSLLPNKLLTCLEQDWQVSGQKLVDYRDCIAHFTPIDFFNTSVSLEKIDESFWSVMVRVPSNPETRSRKKFKYDTDALTYSWNLIDRIISIGENFVDSAKETANVIKK